MPAPISKKTIERALKLGENAKQIGIGLSNGKFKSGADFVCFCFKNPEGAYLLIYCVPDGYLAEIHKDVGDTIETTLLGVRNIRNFLQHMYAENYTDAIGYLEQVAEDEIDLDDLEDED